MKSKVPLLFSKTPPVAFNLIALKGTSACTAVLFQTKSAFKVIFSLTLTVSGLAVKFKTAKLLGTKILTNVDAQLGLLLPHQLLSKYTFVKLLYTVSLINTELDTLQEVAIKVIALSTSELLINSHP